MWATIKGTGTGDRVKENDERLRIETSTLIIRCLVREIFIFDKQTRETEKKQQKTQHKNYQCDYLR